MWYECAPEMAHMQGTESSFIPCAFFWQGGTRGNRETSADRGGVAIGERGLPRGRFEPEHHPPQEFFRAYAQTSGQQNRCGERGLPFSGFQEADIDIGRPDGVRHLLLRKAGVPSRFRNDFTKDIGKFCDTVH